MDLVGSEAAAWVRSREELRFAYVDEQTWDSSCGYAALATLLGRYRGAVVDEASLLARSAPEGGGGVVKVSMAELMRLTRELGFEAQAGRAEYGGLAARVKASPPVLVHYDRPDGHFALVLSAGTQAVVTADPARGLELLTKAQFLARWSGIALVVPERRSPAPSEPLSSALKLTLGRQEVVERALSKGPPKQ